MGKSAKGRVKPLPIYGGVNFPQTKYHWKYEKKQVGKEKRFKRVVLKATKQRSRVAKGRLVKRRVAGSQGKTGESARGKEKKSFHRRERGERVKVTQVGEKLAGKIFELLGHGLRRRGGSEVRMAGGGEDRFYGKS